MWKKAFLACFLLISIYGCNSYAQPTAFHKWQYIDFRLFDPPDCSFSTADILGVYLYQPTIKPDLADIYIRLDMLDVKDIPDMDIYLVVDSQVGGIHALPIQAAAEIAWDWLIVISAAGQIEVLPSSGSNINPPSVTILRDALLDTIEVRMNLATIDAKSLSVKVQSYSTATGDTTVLDSTSIADIWKPPPPRLNVLFAFWNSFPAFTPSQSLRRWDGAHTGPLGGHHGLANLLTTARNHQIPIFLLDFINPVSLSALDYMQSIYMLNELQNDGILALPDSGSVYPTKNPYLLPNGFLEKIIIHHQELREDFRFTPAQSLYSYLSTDQIDLSIIQPYPIIFLPTLQYDPFIKPRWLDGHLIIPIPSNLDSNGIIKPPNSIPDQNMLGAQLVTAGFKTNADHSIFIIGGSLPDSVWGDPQIARTGFQYLNSRPWIRLVSEADLLSLFYGNLIANKHSGEVIDIFNSDDHPRLKTEQLNMLSGLIQNPQRHSSTIAWDTVFQLLSPAYPDYQALPELRSSYWEQVYAFNHLANWIESPGNIHTCKEMYLKSPTCTLASSSFFLVIDQLDGTILFAFFKDRDGFHQLIGPFSQLASGLRDPSLWSDQMGIKAEPPILGTQTPDSQEPPLVEIEKNSIKLINRTSKDELKYTLHSKSILIQYTGNPSYKMPIYFSLDPWLIHSPNWTKRYHSDMTANGWALWVDSSICTLIRTDSQVERYAFNTNQESMLIPENPDAEKKPGDNLPYPLMAGIFSNKHDFFVEISVRDSCFNIP